MQKQGIEGSSATPALFFYTLHRRGEKQRGMCLVQKWRELWNLAAGGTEEAREQMPV
jgi:hypothetical protein